MRTHTVPKQASWSLNAKLRRELRKLPYDFLPEVEVKNIYSEDRDGALAHYDEYIIEFPVVQHEGFTIIGVFVRNSKDEDMIDWFDDSLIAEIDETCAECGKTNKKSRNFIVNPSAPTLLHSTCVDSLPGANVLLRDFAKNEETATDRSRAYPVDQLIRLGLIFAGPGAKEFASRSDAGDQSTASQVSRVLNGTVDVPMPYEDIEEDVAEVLKIGQALDPFGDWARKVHDILHGEYTSELAVTVSSLTLLRNKVSEDAKPKGFFIEDKLDTVRVTLDEVIEREESSFSGYGLDTVNYVHFTSNDGRSILWRTAGQLKEVAEAKSGDELIITKAKVTRRKTYRGEDTTHISYPKFIRV